MVELKWTEAMSVGIEVIDADHRKLVTLINSLARALDGERDPDLLGEVFSALEAYIHEHFTREEALMRAAGYSRLEEHIASHHAFIANVPDLRAQLGAGDQQELATEVCVFLITWLTNHIVGEDFAFARAQGQPAPKDDPGTRRSFLRVAERTLRSRLTLRQRLGLASLVPLLGAIVLSALTLWGSYRGYRQTRSVAQLAALLHGVNGLTHSLQAERGLSSGVLSSGYQRFATELASRRLTTDQALEAFRRQARLQDGAAVPRVRHRCERALEALLTLGAERQRIDQKAVALGAMKAVYTAMIARLLAVADSLAQRPGVSALVRPVLALSAVLYRKEAAGLLRALGTQVLEQRGFGDDRFAPFARLLGEQEGFKRLFSMSADEASLAFAAGLERSDAMSKATVLEQRLLASGKSGQLGAIDSERWFSAMSEKIDVMRKLADHLVDVLERDAARRVTAISGSLAQRAGLLLGLLLLTIGVSWLLLRSVIHPLRQLTRAMTGLARGEREYRIATPALADELSEMIEAYEECRCSLLRADIFAAVSVGRRDLALRSRTLERERYRMLASTDVLTGAINRRGFELALRSEVERSVRYGRPLSALMLDLDHFKAVNDLHGHAAGDEALKALVQTCTSAARETDVVARIGGEEFVVLLPETTLGQAGVLAERIRQRIGELSLVMQGQRLALSVSIGVAEWDRENFSRPQQLLDAADRALYAAKRAGRNRVTTTETAPTG